MNFNADLVTFPSVVHRYIYCAARYLTPLSRSLPSVESPALRESCAAYHGFVMAMLSDMYDSPEAYHLPVMALEKHLDGKKLNGVRRRLPKETEAILSQTRNAVFGYQKLLYVLGQRGKADGGLLTLSPDDRADIARQVKTSVSPISLEHRLQALSRIGLAEREGGLKSEQYPGIFPAMTALACAHQTKPGMCSGFGFFAFQNAEFRNLGSPYRPTPEDYFHPLTAEQKMHAEALHGWASANKLRGDVSTFWKVNYKYKGNQTMCVESQDGVLRVRVTVSYGESDALNERLSLEPPETQRYALRHLQRCTLCNPKCGGPFVTLIGKRNRRCGGVLGFQWGNPVGDDLEMIQHIVGYRTGMIDSGQVKKCGA